MAAVQMTLLQIVQTIMSGLSLDRVNSIQDSEQALQVANIVQDSFYDAVANRHWPHLKQLLVMQDTTDATNRPNYLKLPEGIQEASEVFYNVKTDPTGDNRFVMITYLTPEKFLMKVAENKTTAANVVQVIDVSGVPYHIRNDRAPTFWTSFDDTYIAFDSWDFALDSTVHTTKCWCRGVIMPEFIQDDAFVMDMPLDAQRQIVSDAKSRSSIAFLGKANPKAEQQLTKHERFLSRKAWRARGGIETPDYGRKGSRSSRNLLNKGS